MTDDQAKTLKHGDEVIINSCPGPHVETVIDIICTARVVLGPGPGTVLDEGVGLRVATVSGFHSSDTVQLFKRKS